MAAVVALVAIITAVVLILPRDSESVVERGQRVYDETCSSCHEAADGIGPRLTANLLRSYRTPRTLFGYIKLAMPQDQPGSLTDQDYWAVVGYLGASRTLLPDGMPLNDRTADSLIFRENH